MSTESGEGPSKRTARRNQVYRDLGQGIRTFYEHPYADVDILAVPGLGTNPEESWTWSASGSTEDTEQPKRRFNWIRDPDGLASLFPKSRIMLYDYASAWRGPRKVRATMKSICTWLLDDLKEKRKGGAEIARPLIMIGHSMGGVVIAKTICIAKAKKEFEAIVACTTGCAFFGAPFHGSNMAKIALLYSSVFGNEAYESLLSFLRTERNDTLDEVTDDFMEISNKLVPPINLFCAWEQHKYFKAGVRTIMEVGLHNLGAGTFLVDMESAVLQGAHNVGLTASHRDLVKFESMASDRFLVVKVALEKMMQSARTNVRKRASLLGQNLLSRKFVNQVRQSLEGVDMRPKFRAKVKQRPADSWLTKERLYQEWTTTEGRTDQDHSYLWLKGGPGLGKTNACLAAIQELSLTHLEGPDTDSPTSQNETVLAYFLCEWSSGCCTAEDVLKSFITQIINQDESLAQHAKWFIPNPRYRGPVGDDSRWAEDELGSPGAKATATVDNLWKCLQDMIEDPAINMAHFVISNFHCLETSTSTTALLSKIRENAFALEAEPPASRRVKWLITSRNDELICEYLTAKCVSVIDLENDRAYGAQLKGARQKHARDAVSHLRATKQYSSDLAYYIRNSIESHSEDEKWIDVLCLLLGAMPADSGSLAVRKWLRENGHYNIHKLTDRAWQTILRRNEDSTLEIEELLQALTIAYEPPTLADLSILTQISSIQWLTELVKKCYPILQIGEWNEHKDRVVFSNAQFEKHLSIVAHGPDDAAEPQKRRYHGLMALRCFKWIKSSYKRTESRGFSLDVPPSLARSSTIITRVVDDVGVLEVTNEDDEPDDADAATPQTTNISSFYPIKYLFKHLGEGFPDVAQELWEDDPDFWGTESELRDGWLHDFQTMTPDLRDLNASGMSALHVAAGIGAVEVVSILISKNGKASLSWVSDDGMTALHVAAFNNHDRVVDTLIRAGASIEAGEGGAGTPLHLAALRGHGSIMDLLIERGANVNAFSETIGPVINAAIRSGTVDAVKHIMSREVRFDLDYTKCDPPLSLSAGISEPSLFRDILETGREKWLQNVKILDQAIIAASYSGRLESVQILLKFEHIYTNVTMETAILSAALEKNWSLVSELLDHVINDTAQGNRRDVKVDNVFYLAATSREERLDVLAKAWQFANNSVAQDVCDFALYTATVSKKNSTVVWLLENCKANANATTERPSSIIEESASPVSIADFQNPLDAAAATGNVVLVNALLQKGASVNSDEGYALQLAASEGHSEIVEILLKHGALVNREVANSDELGFHSGTALQAACDHNRINAVKVLVQYGADPNLGGGALTNPITTATQRSESEILKLLLEAPGIDVNVVGGEEKSTPLINAALHMSAEFVELLVQKGAEIDAQNSAGDTALIMAAWKGDKASVDLLCSRGADVTYRSPRRGLAIQAAAEGSHPLCAHVLAEKMGGTIDDYREQVKIDPSKDALDKALATLEDRDQNIEYLSTTLVETRENLETANKEIEFHKLEKERLLSARVLDGETYESLKQQIRLMQVERGELSKELDAARGQLSLANDKNFRVEGLLEDARSTYVALRERQGWAALQEEKQTALEMLSAEKKAALEMSELESRKREALQTEIQRLQSQIRAQDEAVTTAHNVAMAANGMAEIVTQQRNELQSTVEELRSKCHDLETSAQTLKAAEKADVTQSPRRAPEAGSDGRPGMTTSQSHSPSVTPGSPGRTGLPSRTPGPSVESSGFFRTIHGIHRADGSLGGFGPDRAMRRVTRNGLTSNGLSNGRAGERAGEVIPDARRSSSSAETNTGSSMS